MTRAGAYRPPNGAVEYTDDRHKAAPATMASNFTAMGKAQGWARTGSTAVSLFSVFLIQADSTDGPEVEGHLLCWQNKINVTLKFSISAIRTTL